MTKLLLIRHANKQHGFIDTFKDDQLLIGDKNTPLSKIGKEQAVNLSNHLVDSGAVVTISSDYFRACETARYISLRLAIPQKIDRRIGERIRRKNRTTPMPDGFRIQQFMNLDLKCDDGESMQKVISRFTDCIHEIIVKYDNETVIVVSHKTAITMFLSQFCKVVLNDKVELFFDGKQVFDGHWSGGPDFFVIEMNPDYTLRSVAFQRYDKLCTKE